MCSGDKNSKAFLNAINIAESLIKISNNLIVELGKISLTESQQNKRKSYFEFLESTKDLAYKIKYDLIRSALNSKINTEPELFILNKLDFDNNDEVNNSPKKKSKYSNYMVDNSGRLVKAKDI